MDYRRFDLNLLVVLDALLEEGGVNAAARRLGMSQPNVSFALSKLRLAFSDQLLVRRGAGMLPTPLAEALREPIKRVLSGIEREVLAERKFDPLHASRSFVISTSDIGELVFLPQLMRRLAEEAPGITLESRLLSPPDLAKAMAHGDVDVAVGYFPDLVGDAFISDELFEHPFACILREGHPAVNDGWSLDAFLSLGHIVVSQAGRSQELFEAKMQSLGYSRKVQLRSPHFMSVPLLVAQSDLISTVPKAVGVIFSRMVPLQLLDPPFETPSILLRQHWHVRSRDDPAANWLRGLIDQLFKGRDPSPTATDSPMA